MTLVENIRTILRMLRYYFVILKTVILLPTLTLAQTSPQQEFIKHFETTRLAMPNEAQLEKLTSVVKYPEPLNFILETVLSWTPQGKVQLMSTPCDPDVWQSRMQDSRISASIQLQGALVQKYFQECRTELETGKNSFLRNATEMMTMKLQSHQHPFMRRVVLGLPGGVKLKGLLALKGDNKRRPLVVIRLGIFSNVEDFKPERAWLMMLFEQAPFNVLLVENMTSSDFIMNNAGFAFGGYDEGIQNIHIAKILTDPLQPISQLVESVHLFGVSLGGHGVLYASLLNKFNSPKTRPLIQSFTALCPVVDLQKSMEGLVAGGAKSAFVDYWGRQRLKGLDKKIPTLVTYDNFSFLSKAISEVAKIYQGGLSYNSSIQLPPGIKDGTNFWELNNFWKNYKDVQQPVMIYATSQDPAVPFSYNSQRLRDKTLDYSSKNIRVIELPQGIHCTLPVAYDWHSISSLLQSYVLSHSPKFKMVERKMTVDLLEEDSGEFFKNGAHAAFQALEPSKKAGFVSLKVKLENQAGKTKKMRLMLPTAEFDFRFLNSEMTASEQEMLVRWMNQNIRMDVLAEAKQLEVRWSVAK
ncbi:hypothetical protein BDW_02500 [Bdellovibrio bacteriovorus W]|nr:hypothetical protein BDW_02500 [Bdellovibrio bacteriovorus W]